MHATIKSADPLSDSEASEAFRFSGKNHGPIYPWDKWFDGQTRKLNRKDHFPNFSNVRNFYGYIRQTAARKGFKLKCRCHYESNEIVLKAVGNSDAANKNMEGQGTKPSRSVRDSAKTSKRRQPKPR